MIAKVLKGLIEQKFGKKIRYPKDCFALANDISKQCNENISPATLMRLFGITKNSSQPRLFTLDLISEYCGFSSWDEFLEKFTLEELQINNHESIKIIDIPHFKKKDTDENKETKLMIVIKDDNKLVVQGVENPPFGSRKLENPLLVKDAYLFIFDNLEKNSIGKLIKVDIAKLLPL